MIDRRRAHGRQDMTNLLERIGYLVEDDARLEVRVGGARQTRLNLMYSGSVDTHGGSHFLIVVT